MKQVTFVTGNPEKASNFSKHMQMNIAHHDVDVDEIQTLDIHRLVEHKARVAYQQLQTPVLVEDVQFCLKALGKLPGPFVKYFILSEDGDENLCRMLDGFNERGAVASCTYVYFDGASLNFFSGELHGVVAEHPTGEGGFGFDRIFIPDGFGGHTAAELTETDYDRYYCAIKPFTKVRQFLIGQ